MGFFDKIFGKKDKVEVKPETQEKLKIVFSETGAWFESDISEFLETINTEASGFVSQITMISKKLSKHLDILESAESEEEIGSRMKKFAYDNKTSFVNKVRAFNYNIIAFDFKDTLRFYDFFNQTTNDINELTGKTARNIHLAKMLFSEDIKEITDCLNSMADIAHESQKALNQYKDKLDIVMGAREGLKDIERIRGVLVNENKIIGLKSQELKQLYDDKKKADQDIHLLENGEDASKLKQILEQKEKLNTDISKIRGDILQSFSSITKVLKKYERFSTELSRDDEKILLMYIEFPLKAINIDTDFKILSKIIENTEKLISLGKIDFKDKQKEKVLTRLNKLKDTSSLSKSAIEYNQLQEKAKNLKDMLDSMKINRETESARQKLRDIEDMIKSYDLEISRIKIDIESANKDVSFKIKKMEIVFSEIIGKDVSITNF